MLETSRTMNSPLSTHPLALPGPEQHLIIQARRPFPWPACPSLHHNSHHTLSSAVIFITHRHSLQPSHSPHRISWRTSAFSSTPHRHRIPTSTLSATRTNSSTPAAQRPRALQPLQYVCSPMIQLGPVANLMQYDMTFSRDFTGSDTMPSPDVEGEEGSLSPHDQTSATKPAAKRKRENRYKNAPPSVLSVSPGHQSTKRHYHISTTADPTGPQSKGLTLTQALPNSAAEHKTAPPREPTESARTSGSRTWSRCSTTPRRATTCSARRTPTCRPNTSSSRPRQSTSSNSNTTTRSPRRTRPRARQRRASEVTWTRQCRAYTSGATLTRTFIPRLGATPCEVAARLGTKRRPYCPSSLLPPGRKGGGGCHRIEESRGKGIREEILQSGAIGEAGQLLLFPAASSHFARRADWLPLHSRLDAAGLNPTATCLVIRPLQRGPPRTRTHAHAHTRTQERETHTETHAHTHTQTHVHAHIWLEYFWALAWRSKRTGRDLVL